MRALVRGLAPARAGQDGSDLGVERGVKGGAAMSTTTGVLRADGPLGHMPAYGSAHVSMLVLLVASGILVVVWARRGDPLTVDRALRSAGWALLVNSVLWTAWGFTPWAWNLEESLPLHLSDALRFLGAVALITRARWLIVVTYFWGLTLNLQSVLTPDVNYFVSVPLEFAEYWIAHLSGVLIPVTLIWGQRYRPTWRGYGVAYGVTLLWAGFAATGNALSRANYGYLNHAPSGPSILDLLGPWPQYLVVEAVLIAAVWALMTWPWVLLNRRSPAPLTGRGGLLRQPPVAGHVANDVRRPPQAATI
ncbi:TIGR02206 family membrane protein [Brachybacterium alimentarium]